MDGLQRLVSKFSYCEPELYVGDKAANGEIAPCGLIAWSLFNDTFVLKSAPDAATKMSEQGIADPQRATNIVAPGYSVA